MSAIQMVEVAPRDGLQAEPDVWSTEDKVEMISRLVGAGASRIEVASFVNPERVPQMADGEAVLEALGPSAEGVSWIGLVLNRRGAERAVGTPVDELNGVVTCTDTFGERNQGAPWKGTVERWAEIAEVGRAADRKLSVTMSVAFGCPFEGEVTPERVAEVAAAVVEAGRPDELALADTIGVAAPTDVTARIDAVRQATPDVPLRLHVHNTRNTAVANVAAAVEAGVTVIDASAGGIGGCPFAPNATGNVATEDVAYLLERMGYDTGLDLGRMAETVEWIEKVMGRRVPGLYAKAGPFPKP